MTVRFLAGIAVAAAWGCGVVEVQEEDERPEVSAQVAGRCSGVDTTSIWRPKQGMTWDWQLRSPVDTGVDVDIYDIDAFGSERVISTLHAQGKKVVCYVNVGAWEPYRPDAKDFPEEILGKPWSETKYADERWLDIRRLDVLGPILEKRLDMAKKKGCDAIEPDNIDGYQDWGSRGDRTGFDLTAADQLAFNRYIACEAHERGMSVALKNDAEQAAALADDFDFVVNEQCFQYGECKAFRPFLDAGKAVLVAEYVEDLADRGGEAAFARFCEQSKTLGTSTILKRNALDSWRRGCPE